MGRARNIARAGAIMLAAVPATSGPERARSVSGWFLASRWTIGELAAPRFLPLGGQTT
jgi:hypothetical protein